MKFTKLTAVTMALLITFSAVSYGGIGADSGVASAETVQSGFDYTNADNYVADCLSQGVIDGETGKPVPTGPVVYETALSHEYTYERLAKAYLDDPGLITNSMIWTSWQSVCSGDFSGMSQQTIYEAIIMDYLASQLNAATYESQMIKDATKYGWDISKDLLDGLTEEEASLKDVLKEKTAEELKQTAGASEALDNLSGYTTIVKELDDIRGSADEYAHALAQAMALKEADQQRIDFLFAMKEAASDNTDFCDAVDSVIAKLEASKEENTLNEGLKVMGKYAVSKAWGAFTDTYTEFSALNLGVDTMDLLFNSNDTAANRVKLMLLYTMDQYARQALNRQNTAYKKNGSWENAVNLNNSFQSFLAYQEYATNWSRTFITDITFEGLKNKIKNLFSSENQQTYDRYMMMFDGDVNFTRREAEYLDKWSALYEKIVSAEDVFESGAAEVTLAIPEDAIVYNGHAYKTFEIGLTWSNAQAYCKSLGGHLVSVASAEEQEVIFSLLLNKKLYWLGGYMEDEIWKWNDSSKFTYSNWNPGRPDNYWSDEFYVCVYGQTITYGEWIAEKGKWDDVSNKGGEDAGTEEIGFICEWDAIVAPDHSGDLSCDGSLNTLDAVILQMQLLNTYTFTDDQWSIADVTEDGQVDAFDLAILKRKLLMQ